MPEKIISKLVAEKTSFKEHCFYEVSAWTEKQTWIFQTIMDEKTLKAVADQLNVPIVYV